MKNRSLDRARVESKQTALLTLGLHTMLIVAFMDWGWAREIPKSKAKV